ncbi:hypothetical protein Salat_1114000 [Sesamum alatum]|uniref:DUF4283 domain-containing protein n=1 Tax=Sesamum alatum TaxID=300844 RepID=A0AAE2CT43_9LAMI|nr:hypothetical protein Salat_1114000 [Sesamum alatum]
MRVFKWTPSFNPREESPIVPVWVRLSELPIQFFEREALFSIARLLGAPLRTDVSTATLVRPSVARVCIEINLLEPLQMEIGLGFGTDVTIQKVVKAPAQQVERDGQQTPGPAREDLRVKLDAQRAQRALDDRCRGKRVVFAEHDTRPHLGASTSGSKGDGEETCGDMPHEETTEPVIEEVPHTTPAVDQQTVEEMTGSGREPVVQGPTIGQSQDPKVPTPRHVEHGFGDSLETRPNDLSHLVTGTEDEVIALTGEGVVQTDEEAVTKRVARHRRGRSMGEDPSGQSASPDYGKAVSPPRRIVTRSTVRSTIP